MKWMNKGHEFDKIAMRIPDVFRKKIFVFGAGQLGKTMGLCLNAFGLLGGYIDNDVRRYGTLYLDKPILSLNEYLNIEKNIAIVIAVSNNISASIVQQLKNEGLEHEKDFFCFHEFIDKIFPIIATYYFDKTFIRLVQITLTERCSLKCKKCAHGCYNVDNTSKDMPLSSAYKSADSFFSKVDFINEFVLIGGEPLLYKDLSDVITYVGEKYRNQIAIYSITTNGTIVPTKEVLEACRRYDVLFRISNYSQAIPRLTEFHKRLIAALEEYGVRYILAPVEGTWIDYGFDYFDRGLNEEELIQAFDHCLTPCREVRESRLYFCVMARSVSDNLNLGEGKEDYLDLDKLSGEDYKKELLEFNLGYSEKGYLDMCRRCHGMDAVNYPIPVAEQVKV